MSIKYAQKMPDNIIKIINNSATHFLHKFRAQIRPPLHACKNYKHEKKMLLEHGEQVCLASLLILEVAKKSALCWQRAVCRIAVEWYEMCRHFGLRNPQKKRSRKSDYRQESYK